MKLSKSLLQAIVLGVSLGTATTSCDLVQSSVEPDPKIEKQGNETEETSTRQSENQPGGTCGEGGGEIESCAACGMG